MSNEHWPVVDALSTLCGQLGVKCLVQIGAETGHEANVIRMRTGCRAIAIEGNSQNQPCSPELEWHTAVIGATDCMMPFHFHQDPALSGHFRRADGLEFPMAMVEQQRLDTFCAAHDITPDALIIDTEGSTQDVLDGCGALLDGLRLVYAECQREDLREGMRPAHETDAFLKARGMTFHSGLPSYATDGKQGNYTWTREP